MPFEFTQPNSPAATATNGQTSGVDPDMLERLRASRETVSHRREAEGAARGLRWAQTRAEYDQLERVAGIDVDALIDQDGSAQMELAVAVLDDKGLSWDDVREAMEGIGFERYPVFDEIVGFIEGAEEVFNQV